MADLAIFFEYARTNFVPQLSLLVSSVAKVQLHFIAVLLKGLLQNLTSLFFNLEEDISLWENIIGYSSLYK